MNNYPTGGGEGQREWAMPELPILEPPPLYPVLQQPIAVPPGDKAVSVPASANSVTATELQPLLISMLRGVAEAFVLAAVAVFTMLAAVPDADARAIFIVAGATFFTKLAAAFGFGTVDQRTAQKEG